MAIDISFNQTTLTLFLVFISFVFIAYTLIKIIIKTMAISFVSMMFPVILFYFGIISNLSINTILMFGLLGTGLYLVFFVVQKAVDAVFSALEFATGAVKRHGKKKTKHRRHDEVEIESDEEI